MEISESIETLQWLSPETIHTVSQQHNLPVYIYSEKRLLEQIDAVLAFPHNKAFGLTCRFAMKANPNRSILQLMRSKGILIDASSGYEARRAILAGYLPSEIQLTAQELPLNLQTLIEEGVTYNACSLRQLEAYGKLFPGTSLGLRWNPGVGSGSSFKTDVGGPTSSFGIWHEHMDQVKALVATYDLKIVRIHTHIGSGTDPKVWGIGAKLTLDIAEQFPTCRTVNLGGGFKVGRMTKEKSVNLQDIGAPIQVMFEEYHQRTGIPLHLEIEPGTYLVAATGSILCQVDDIVDTGDQGYTFIKVNTGMDSLTRPSLYGSQHPLVIVSREPSDQTQDYVIVGHCCESGDMFTQSLGGNLEVRKLQKSHIGDLLVIEGTGAYCSSMSTKNYNSFPELEELMVLCDGTIKVIKKKQTIEQMIQNETL